MGNEAMTNNYKKKAVKFLTEAYDDAHFKAPYGTHVHADPGLGMLMDFYKGWMAEFLYNGYNVVASGVGNGNATKPEQKQFLALLFQTLISPQCACVPRELAAMLTEAPPQPWPFLQDAAERCFIEWTQKPSKPKAGKEPAGIPGLPGGYEPVFQSVVAAPAGFGRPY